LPGSSIRRGLVHRVAYTALSTLAITTMSNGPGIGYGYGLVYASAAYAVLAFRPLEALVLYGLAHVVASYVLIASSSVFTIVAIASLALRPPVVYLVARAKSRLGPLGSLLLLLAVDSIVALSISILRYGDDGIHVGLTVYEGLLIPMVYLAWKSSRDPRGPARILAAAASTASLYAYTASLYAYPALATLASSIAGGLLVYVGLSTSKGLNRLVLPATALAVVAVGIALGGSSLSWNLGVMHYPLKPSSWGLERWAQTEPGCPQTSNLLAGVHDPERLRIVDPCVRVSGVVASVPFIASDGDYCFDLEVDRSYGGYPSLGSLILRHGRLHVEVVPSDLARILGPTGVCPGDRVEVRGALVVDTDHGLWAEVHPAYEVRILERASRLPWPQCLAGVASSG